MNKLAIFLKFNEVSSLPAVLIKTKPRTGIKNNKTAGLLLVGKFTTSKIGTRSVPC